MLIDEPPDDQEHTIEWLLAWDRYREIENLLDDMDIIYIPLTFNQHPKLARLMELLAERREIRRKIK